MTVYCTDATKLAAADSFLTADKTSIANVENITLLQLSPDSDPEALTAFEDVVTLMTNPVILYYRWPRHIGSDGIVERNWARRAGDSDLNLPHDPSGASAPVPFADSEKIKEFVDYFELSPHNGCSNAAAAAQWLRFHASNEHIMKGFWYNNSEEDLEQCRSLVKDIQLPNLTAQIARCANTLIASSNVARGFRSMSELSPDWEPLPFSLAYLFWSFLKGYRYSGAMREEINKRKPGHGVSYCVHFIRRAPIVTLGPAREIELDCFPWGPLVRQWMWDAGLLRKEAEKPDFVSHVLSTAIYSLHSHTAASDSLLKSLANQNAKQAVRAAREFALDGARKLRAIVNEPTDSFKGTDSMATLVGYLATKRFLKLYLGIVKRQLTNSSQEEIDRVVSYWWRTEDINRMLDAGEPAIRRYLEASKVSAAT